MKMLLAGSIRLDSISKEIRSFLESLQIEKTIEEGLPVYVRSEDEDLLFIEDFELPSKANRKFEREAPKGIYRGGAIIKVTCKHGILVVPDERYGWFKPFAGLARYSEGRDLIAAGTRELIEEAFVYDIAKTTRFVPKRCATRASTTCSLDFTVSNVQEVGEIQIIGWEINEKNRAFEAVLEWDITELEQEFSVSLEERWWSGGRNGVSVFVVDRRGSIVGLFSGQQGFLKIHEFGVHETLRRYL
jgi:hypothetical protein